MKDLLELVQIVTKPKLRSVELVGDWGVGDSKLAEFYEALSEGRFQTDEEAAAYFYQDGKQNSAYQKLRSSLKDRLISSLFIIDVKRASYSDRQRAFYECYRDWAAAKILFGKNARTAAVGLSSKILKIAGKLEFTELILDVYRSLRLYFGTIEGDLKKFEQYNALYKKYEAIWRKENLAEELYIDLSIRYVNSKATKNEVHERAEEHFRQPEPLLEEIDSYQLHLCARLIEMIVYSSINDYRQTMAVCERMIDFFEQKPYLANIPLQIAYYQKMTCLYQLREFAGALEAAEKSGALLEEGSFNWFKYRELYFLTYLHSEKFEEAREVFQRTVDHPNFKDLPRNVVETWMIFEAYLKYLMLAGHMSLGEGEDKEEINFRLGRFLNEISVFSKDKQGMNIPVLIIEMLFTILNRNFDLGIDRVEAIDKYRSRYLREEHTIRSNHFIKMLLQLPRNGFDPALAAEKVAKDLEALRATPIELAQQTHEIEILPYEKLWEIVLDDLEKQ